MDYHQILQIPKSATLDEIKSSYRRLAKLYHPDINKSTNAAELFRHLTIAYEALSVVQKHSTPPPPKQPIRGEQLYYRTANWDSHNFYVFDIPEIKLKVDTVILAMIDAQEIWIRLGTGIELPITVEITNVQPHIRVRLEPSLPAYA